MSLAKKMNTQTGSGLSGWMSVLLTGVDSLEEIEVVFKFLKIEIKALRVAVKTLELKVLVLSSSNHETV